MRANVAARPVAALDVMTGLLLVAVPARVLHAVAVERDARATVLVRALGARSTAQGVALVLAPRRHLLVAVGAVDLLHATTMVALAVARPRYRRAAFSSATLATISGSLSLILARGVRT
ncbi:MAG: hypothetical protein ABI232_01215 [Jatrophihabitantaceae bacterium]